MDESERKSAKTCQGCKHWKKASAIAADGTINTGPPMGECRQGPPSAFPVVHLQQTGPQQININVLQTLVLYPPVPGSFAACDRWEKSVRVEVGV